MTQGILRNSIKEAVQAISLLQTEEAGVFIEQAARLIAATFRNGNKVILAGNGGSLCDASHFAEELTGQFRHKRPALPAIVLSEPGHLTCVGNDFGFESVFSRGVEAFGQPGDLFIGLSTSGNSKNLVRAFAAAKERGLSSMAFLGKDGGEIAGMADLEWIIRGFSYSDRIQEVHMAAIHIIIEVMESLLFPVNSSTSELDKQLESF